MNFICGKCNFNYTLDYMISYWDTIPDKKLSAQNLWFNEKNDYAYIPSYTVLLGLNLASKVADINNIINFDTKEELYKAHNDQLIEFDQLITLDLVRTTYAREKLSEIIETDLNHLIRGDDNSTEFSVIRAENIINIIAYLSNKNLIKKIKELEDLAFFVSAIVGDPLLSLEDLYGNLANEVGFISHNEKITEAESLLQIQDLISNKLEKLLNVNPKKTHKVEKDTHSYVYESCQSCNVKEVHEVSIIHPLPHLIYSILMAQMKPLEKLFDDFYLKQDSNLIELNASKKGDKQTQGGVRVKIIFSHDLHQVYIPNIKVYGFMADKSIGKKIIFSTYQVSKQFSYALFIVQMVESFHARMIRRKATYIDFETVQITDATALGINSILP